MRLTKVREHERSEMHNEWSWSDLRWAAITASFWVVPEHTVDRHSSCCFSHLTVVVVLLLLPAPFASLPAPQDPSTHFIASFCPRRLFSGLREGPVYWPSKAKTDLLLIPASRSPKSRTVSSLFLSLSLSLLSKLFTIANIKPLPHFWYSSDLPNTSYKRYTRISSCCIQEI